MLWLIKTLLRKRKVRPVSGETTEAPRPSKLRKARPEWDQVLLASLEGNNLAPPEEVILHAFDLYKNDLFEPIRERRLLLAVLYAEIVADVASLQALVPGLIERAMARHPLEFEFSNTIDHKEVR